MMQDGQGVIQAAKNITSTFNHAHPGNIQNYVLTTVVDNTITNQTFTNASNFLSALALVHFGGFKNCSQPILTAILKTLPLVIPGSPIFIFTDALPSDTAMMTNVMHINSVIRAQLNFVLTNPTPSAPQCAWNSGAPGYAAYQSLSAFSQGSVMQVSKSQVQLTFYSFYLTGLHQLATILTNDFAKCSSQPALTTFFVDSEVIGLDIEVFTSPGNAPITTITTPSGKQMTLSPSFAAGNAALYIIAKSVGAYTLSVKAGSANSGPCSYRIRGQTTLHMFPGYSSSLRTDVNTTQPFYNQPIHPVVHMNLYFAPLINMDNVISQMMIYQTYGTPIYMSTAQYRALQCQYQLYYSSWTCKIPGQMFYITVFGQDQNGYTFQRSNVGFCKGTAPPVNTCQNGGVLFNQQCICPAYWSGKYCTIAQCLNGGTSVGAACKCPAGFSDAHCSTTLCSSKNPNVTNSANGRSLAFVIQTTITEYYDLQQIQANINSTLNQINQQSVNWYSRYILVQYNDQTATQTLVTSNQAKFLQYVKQLQISFNAAACPKVIGSALTLALQPTSNYGSVFVFTDSVIGDLNQLPGVYALMESTKAQVNFIITNPAPCGQNFTTTASKAMQQLAAFSDGQAFIVEKPTIAPLMNYIPLLYSSGLAFTGGAPNCNSFQTYYFPVDSHTTSYTISTSGYLPTTKIYLPSGQLFTAAVPIVSNSQFLQVYRIFQEPHLQKMVPGIWKVTVQTKPYAGKASGCFFQVRAQSNLNLYYGFVRNVHNDFPTKEPLQIPGYNDRMVAHMTNLPSSGSLEYMNMYLERSGQLAGTARFGMRSGCGYEFMSQGFQCPASAFGVLVAGYDERNYLYNRIRVATCIATTNPCLNGGVLYMSRCLCTPFWTGPTCGTAICQNGATNAGTKCICAPGFTGPHCSFDMCTKQVPASFSPNGRSLTFVIDGTIGNAGVIQQLRQFTQGVLAAINQQHPGWITRYVLLIYYDGAQEIGPITNTTSLPTFAAALNTFVLKTTNDCPNPAMTALNAVLPYVLPNSQIYLFTMATAKDPGTQKMVITKAQLVGAQINFVLGDENPCSANGKTAGYQAYQHVALATGGNIFLTPGGTPKFLNYIGTQYQGSLVGQFAHPSNCTVPTTIYIPVDGHTSTMTFAFSGFGQLKNVVWKNPSGQRVSSFSMLVVNNFQIVGTFTNPAPGIWSLTSNTLKGGCNIQVTAQSSLVAYIGYQSNIHSDTPNTNPIGGKNSNNYMVGHVTNLVGNGKLEYVNFYNPSYTLGASARFMPRKSCSYEWYSQVFQCPAQQMGVLLSGTDDMGYFYERHFVSECIGGPVTVSHPIIPTKSTKPMTTVTMPKTTPFGPKCNLKQLMYDVIFVVDDSSSIGPQGFQQVKNFMSAFAGNYTIGGGSNSGTQIALVKYDLSAVISSQLNTVSTQAFVQALIQSQTYDGFVGENIENALLQVQGSLLKPQNGYRAAAQHILVLISSGSWTNISPVPVAQQLRAAGLHIFAIGYGLTANSAQLQQIAGANCVYTIPNTSNLMTKALPWLEAKTCSKQWC